MLRLILIALLSFCPALLHAAPTLINPANGNVLLAETDYSGHGPAALEIRRYYNSISTKTGRFGPNWSDSYARALTLQTTATPATAKITRPDGKVFTFQGSGVAPWQASPANGAFLSDVPGGGWKLATPDETEYYDKNGRLTALQNSAGFTLSFSYNAKGQLTRVATPFGRFVKYTYDTANRVTTATDSGKGVYLYAYNADGLLAAVTYPDNSTRQYLYGEAGFVAASAPNLLTGLIDESNQRFYSWTYNASGQAINRTHPGGLKSVSMSYSGSPSAITTATDAAGKETTYRYTTTFSVPRLVAKTNCPNCGGGATNRTYDAAGRITSMTDPEGRTTTYTTDDQGRITSKTDPLGYTTGYSWQPDGTLLYSITEPARTTAYAYNAAGQTTAKTVSGGGKSQSWNYTYDAAGLLVAADGPRDDVTDTTGYQYDTLGRLTVITDALGGQTRFSNFDAHDRPLTVTAPDGVVTRYTFDARGRILTQKVAGLTTAYAYTPTGLLSSITQPDGTATTFTYDAANDLATATDPKGNKLVLTRDLTGKVTARELRDAAGIPALRSTYTYDSAGKLVVVENGKGGRRAYAYAYDQGGKLIATSDELGNATSYAYDAMKRLTGITDPLGGTVNIARDSEGKPVTVTDATGVATTYSYDALGYKTGDASFDAGTQTFVPDGAGNITQRSDGAGRGFAYSFDALNQLTRIAAGGETFDFGFEPQDAAASRLKRAAGAYAASDFVYDAKRRLSQRTDTIGTNTFVTARRYTADGKLAKLIYPSGKVINFTYDATGALTTVGVGAQTDIAQIAYTPFGQIAGWVAGGKTYARSYNGDGEITRISGADGDFAYTRDAAGRIAATSDGTNTQSYAYDAAGRLVEYTGAGGDQGYQYDANGNRVGHRVGGTTYPYDKQPGGNRLAGIQTLANAYAFDNAGNVLSDGTLTFTYNDTGRLAGVAKGVDTLATYRYNAFGQRVSKITASATRHFVYDEGGLLLGEYDGNGAVVQEYVWINNLPAIILTAKAKYYVRPDHLGTPRAVYDKAGAIVWRWDSDPFGATPAVAANPAKFTLNLRFPGQYFDEESGLHYNYFREYEPATGRYTSCDPIGLMVGMNRYGYVGGNPLSYTDPLGLEAEMCYRPVQGPIPGQHCFARFNGDDGDTSSFDPTGVGPDPKPKGATCEKAKGPEDDNCVKREMKKCQNYHFTKNNCCHCVEQALKACGQSVPASKWPNWPINPGPQPGEPGRKP